MKCQHFTCWSCPNVVFSVSGSETGLPRYFASSEKAQDFLSDMLGYAGWEPLVIEQALEAYDPKDVTPFNLDLDDGGVLVIQRHEVPE